MKKPAKPARPMWTKKEPTKKVKSSGIYNFQKKQKSMYRTSTQIQSGTGATRNVKNK